jgi:amino acid adenylation domain-containing protein
VTYRYLLSQAIDQAADRSPASEAIRCDGRSLSYADLVGRSNQLARHLTDRGVRRGDRVGLYMNKSIESAVGVYGALKAGAAYVPLDPFAPPARLAYVIRDCGIRHLVTLPDKQEVLREILAGDSPVEHVVGLPDGSDVRPTTTAWDDLGGLPTTPAAVRVVEQDLAYILYTSGSTGTPKGIMHTHRSGLSFAEWAAAEYGLRAEDRLSNHAPLHFDLSTFDLFAGAIAGATTVIIPEGVTKFPVSLARLIEGERISVWYSVPFALIQLLLQARLATRDLQALRWVLFAGEPFPTKHLRAVMAELPRARFSNLYGPTETNVCTFYHVEPLSSDEEVVPIGRPCANVEDLVVDGDDRPVAPGETGELLIRGGVVMMGYWGMPERTAQGFFRRLAADGQHDTFYRTGDLVQQRPDGNYSYLGRKDRQIKTRGYRVELDEIEVALLAHSGVEQAAVYAVPDNQGSHLIEAAVVPRPGRSLETAELMEHLAGRLPPYALPSRLTVTEDFPRTSTGKIDRRTLQAQAAQPAAS